MTYQTILVHLTDERRLSRVLGPAITLARRSGAHLAGLTVLPPVIVEPAFVPGGVVTIIDSHRKAYEKERARMRERFEAAVRDAGIRAEWQPIDCDETNVWQEVAKRGGSADLIIASEPDPSWTYSHMMEAPAEVILHSGRPVLLIPLAGHHADLGRRVIVAWNGKREAARAAHDALPLLRDADKVTVLWINPEDDMAAGDVPGADLCTTLARHGVKCDAASVDEPGRDTGEILLSRARETGADLIVMGCYGHSRLKEFILGGATRRVLKDMTVPVLMSH